MLAVWPAADTQATGCVTAPGLGHSGPEHWYVPWPPMVCCEASDGHGAGRSGRRAFSTSLLWSVIRVAGKRHTPARSSPLYLWVAALLRDQIEAGRFDPREPIPSERVLAERYGVSRMTARHAVEILTLEGYVLPQPTPGDVRGRAPAALQRRELHPHDDRGRPPARDRGAGGRHAGARSCHLPDARPAARRPGPSAAAAAHGEGRTDRHREHPRLGGALSPACWSTTSPARCGSSSSRATACVRPRPTPASWPSPSAASKRRLWG